jgi:hypothetical protein
VPDLDAYGRMLAEAFPDPERAKEQYDAGEFLFRAYPAGINELGPDYGEALSGIRRTPLEPLLPADRIHR